MVVISVFDIEESQWVALFTTDLDLTVEQIIEYYGARWKIEPLSKRSSRKSVAQKAKLETTMPLPIISTLQMAATVNWIYADHLDKTRSVVTLLTVEVTLPFRCQKEPG